MGVDDAIDFLIGDVKLETWSVLSAKLHVTCVGVQTRRGA